MPIEAQLKWGEGAKNKQVKQRNYQIQVLVGKKEAVYSKVWG